MKQAPFISVNEDFRNTISTSDKEGNRIWIYPKKPSGKFTNARELLALVLLAVFFAGPFLTIGGEPILLLNIAERKFIILGQIFWPQDFYIFLLAMITFIVFIIVFTLVYGRIFCGWICPQTIFMEMVFRKIEYWIEGDRSKQKALDKESLTERKFFKKAIKHGLFLTISVLVSNTFLAYIIGKDKIFEIITDNPVNHITGLTMMIAFSLAFYFIFSRFREQVCIAVCPYGRLQGVLMDKNTIVVGYDYLRGENRGKLRKGEDRKSADKGDCIDCRQCVDVCPTGIDIRNGTQLECINCTACIDACNHVMEKSGLPLGLIRYDSENGIATGKKFTFGVRRLAYTMVLVALTGILTFLLVSRSEVETTIVRASGTTFQKDQNGSIKNLFTYKVINKSAKEIPLEFRLVSHEGSIQVIGKEINLPKHQMASGSFFITIEPHHLTGIKTKVKVGIFDDKGKMIEKVTTNFIGPSN
ncbi:MAG: cytochrome c oxidase accessory protein CcoG [Cytophagaceae bacterium]